MERIKNYESFVEDFKHHYEIEPPKGSREFFITKEFEYSREDFFFVVNSILDEILTEIQQQLFSYISIPKNHSDIVSIDYEYVQKRKKELHNNYGICINYKRKLSSMKIKKCYSIEKTFLEECIKNIDLLEKFCSQFILDLNENFQNQLAQIDEDKQQSLTRNMYA